jgi:predicted transcriptional regulator
LSKSLRVDDETYRKLCEIAGKLQSKLKRPVSVDEAIRSVIQMPQRNQNKITDLAGTWKLTDEELREIIESLRKGWRRWNHSKYA